MLLLESVSHSRKLESSLKNKNQDLDLRGERDELKFWISRSVLLI
jgi:CCR4-NOT transcriptional regulation complex NOT5 subunit